MGPLGKQQGRLSEGEGRKVTTAKADHIVRTWGAPFEAQGRVVLRAYMTVVVAMILVRLNLNPHPFKNKRVRHPNTEWTSRIGDELFGGDEGAVAGDAAPDAAVADPGVGVAGADDVFFAFVGAGFAVDAVDHGGVAVDVDGHAFVEKVIGFLFRGGDPLQVFGFVHDGAVVVGVDECVVDELGDFVDLLAGFGLVPGAFELADLDFVGVGCGFLLR